MSNGSYEIGMENSALNRQNLCVKLALVRTS